MKSEFKTDLNVKKMEKSLYADFNWLWSVIELWMIFKWQIHNLWTIKDIKSVYVRSRLGFYMQHISVYVQIGPRCWWTNLTHIQYDSWWRLGHPHHVPLYIVYVTSLHSLLHRLYVFHYATYIPLCNIVFCHQHTNCNISFKSPILSCYQHLQRRHCVNNLCLFGLNNSWCN